MRSAVAGAPTSTSMRTTDGASALATDEKACDSTLASLGVSVLGVTAGPAAAAKRVVATPPAPTPTARASAAQRPHFELQIRVAVRVIRRGPMSVVIVVPLYLLPLYLEPLAVKRRPSSASGPPSRRSRWCLGRTVSASMTTRSTKRKFPSGREPPFSR